MLVPAAMQDVIDTDVAAQLKAGIVVEGANLPVNPAGLNVLRERGVVVVPDFIANAGGVVAAAFAMDARYSVFPVEREPVLRAISDRLRTNTHTVLDDAQRLAVTTHAAAARSRSR